MLTTRRGLFKRLTEQHGLSSLLAGLIGGGFASTLKTAASGGAFEVRPDSFVGGYVKEAGPGLLVVDGGAGPARLALDRTAQIWKGNYDRSARDIAVGDFLYATAFRLASGEMQAVKVWVNIVNLQGTLRAVRPDDLDLEFVDHHGRRHLHPVRLRSHTEVYAGAESPALAGRALLAAGKAATIVGECKPEGVEAFRIWI